jgi:hypothetical protein
MLYAMESVMFRASMISLLSILLFYPHLTFTDSIYLGNDKDGLALSPNEAIEKAK